MKRQWVGMRLRRRNSWSPSWDEDANLGYCRYDDLVEEERESTQIALKRLSTKESYDRIYRIRRSVQCSYQHKLLPKDQWTKPSEVRQLPTSQLDFFPLLVPSRSKYMSGSANRILGHSLPARHHRPGRDRNGREGRPRLHDCHEEALSGCAGKGRGYKNGRT